MLAAMNIEFTYGCMREDIKISIAAKIVPFTPFSSPVMQFVT